jgi:hypothetical protein
MMPSEGLGSFRRAIRRRLQWATEGESEQKLGLRLVLAVRGSEDCDENPSSREFLFKIARERYGAQMLRTGHGESRMIE